FVGRLAACERDLLARKKQRALEELEFIIAKLKTKCLVDKSLKHLNELENMLRNPPPNRQPDWDEVASRWLDLIRPVWFDRLSGKRSKLLLLKDIRRDLLAKPDWLIAELENHFREFPVLRGHEERIKACIIGVN